MGAIRYRGLWLGAVLLAGQLPACASIRFEMSPYSVRDLVVVYSEQEDLTFLVWRIGADADPERVRFQLWQAGGEYQDLQLEEAPFPAEPYLCDGERAYCLQYQLEGFVDFIGKSPVRTVHVDEGIFAGPAAMPLRALTTFSIAPIGLYRNTRIDAGWWGWFPSQGVPLRRTWEWQLVRHSPSQCGSPDANAWQPLAAAVKVGHGWVEAPSCMSVRPKARAQLGTVVSVPLSPSAETRFETQEYIPRKSESPIVYGVLWDLHIPNQTRCDAIQNALVGALRQQIGDQGSNTELGPYTPRRADGTPLSGCDQTPERHYPVTEIVEATLLAAQEVGHDELRPVWIYLNNINSYLNDGLEAELSAILEGILERTHLFAWAIASGAVAESYPFSEVTHWRPIEDAFFFEDLERTAESTLPFATMLHDANTKVPIHDLQADSDPVAFKLCYSSPLAYAGVGVGADPPAYDAHSPHVPWPQNGVDRPYYIIELEEQFLVPRSTYFQYEIIAAVEICERFCDRPFRAHDGQDYPSWSRTPVVRPMEKCVGR